jgi:hypothetical protein
MSGAAFLLQKLITEREAGWLSEPEVDSPLITVHD